MAGALPPGAWWEAKPRSTNGNQPPQVCQSAMIPGAVCCLTFQADLPRCSGSFCVFWGVSDHAWSLFDDMVIVVIW